MAGLGTRAVTLSIQPSQEQECSHCEKPIKYRARHHDRYIAANIYNGNKWDRLELYHADCYKQAGTPYGKAPFTKPPGSRLRSKT